MATPSDPEPEPRLDGSFPWVPPDTDWEWLDLPANPEPDEAEG